MSRKNELEIKLEKIFHVYMFAKEAYLYTEYFHNPDSTEESSLVHNSTHSSDISLISHLMFRALVVELSKLYRTNESENDKFQLEKFIKSLNPSGHFRSIGVPTEYVLDWQDLIQKQRKTIDNLLYLRDKIYAHTTNPLKDYSHIEISFQELKQLLNLAEKIIKSIYQKVFDTEVDTESISFNRNRFTLLKVAADGEKQRIEEITKRFFKD
jgi:hypothetical protein